MSFEDGRICMECRWWDMWESKCEHYSLASQSYNEVPPDAPACDEFEEAEGDSLYL